MWSRWVSEWVTRSPIELFWTAKNQVKQFHRRNEYQYCPHKGSAAHGDKSIDSWLVFDPCAENTFLVVLPTFLNRSWCKIGRAPNLSFVVAPESPSTLPPFLINPFFSSFFSPNREYNPDPIFRPHRTFILLKRKSGNACNCLINLLEFYPGLFFACSAIYQPLQGSQGGEVHLLSARVHQPQWNKRTGQGKSYFASGAGCYSRTRWGGLIIYWTTSPAYLPH